MDLEDQTSAGSPEPGEINPGSAGSTESGTSDPSWTDDNRIRSDDAHTDRANVLAETIKSEVEEKGFSIQARSNPSPWQRILFAIVLIAAVIAPQVLPVNKSGPAATGVSSDILAIQRIIASLPPEALILIGADYQPGFSGELQRLALPILMELIQRQDRLVFISTLPTGPLQAEALSRAANQSVGYPFKSSPEVLNIGYLPGGRTGLQKLVGIGESVFPDALKTQSESGERPAHPVQTASDFDLVWVISDSPETARNWIEQVGPYLAGTPLIMALSAQAAPIIRPYVNDQGPVQALIAGLPEGLVLANLFGTDVTDGQTLAAYNLGIWTFVALAALFCGYNFFFKKRSAV